MPELPEVEAARRAVEEHCVGKRILKCTAADDTKVIDGVSPSDLESALAGKTILAAHRKGKHLWLSLDAPPFPSFQFGMSGAFYIKGVAVTKYKRSAVSPDEEWPSKYSKVFLELDDGSEVSFTDKRRFARVRLLKDPESMPPISELGPDALFQPMQYDEFADSLCKRKIPIKTLLLDQSYISGIGNWVADEVLYQARIHPQQTAASLSKESSKALHRSIKEVIQYAVAVDADSSRFPIEWLFHFRWGKKSGKVNGKTIDFITAGGRTTAYVPELQKLSGSQPGKVPQSRSKKTKSSANTSSKEGSADEEEQEDVKSKPKKSQNRSGGTKKRQAKTSQDDDDGDENQPKKVATGATQKQKVKPKKPAQGTKKDQLAEEDSSKKRSRSSQESSQKNKRTRK